MKIANYITEMLRLLQFPIFDFYSISIMNFSLGSYFPHSDNKNPKLTCSRTFILLGNYNGHLRRTSSFEDLHFSEQLD
jgi:hypothetical protein